MFEFDASQIGDKLREQAKTLRTKAIPFAARNGVNRTAFEGRRIWQAEISDAFTLRNKFTANSIRVTKARSLDPRRMVAYVGSIADYMPTQESGGSETKAIPTEVAAGQSMGSQPRTRTVRGANKMTAIRLTDRNRTADRKVRNIIAIRRARQAGNKYVLLELENGPGIFRMYGGRRRLKLRMVWDLRKTTHRIPPHPTLQPTLDKLGGVAPGIHHEALLEQLSRHGLFGYGNKERTRP